MSTAPRIIESSAFFSDGVPSRIPDDAPSPSFDSILKRASALDSSEYPLESLIPVLVRENHALGAAPVVLDILNDTTRPPLFVVAGQQAGLFGGPLYTLYKALHAVRLAARLSDAAGRPVVPLFWVASDDHDMDEVSRLGLRSDDGSAVSVAYVPQSYKSGMPVGEVVLDEGIENAITALAASLPPGDASAGYLDMLRSTWQPGTGWTKAFSAWLMRLLGPYGLVLIDPRWDGMKRLMIPVMRTELDHPLVLTGLVNEAADSFQTARERKHALRRPTDATNLFFEDDGIRHQISWDGNLFHAGEMSMSPDEAVGILEASPERFSPGAALRPVCQDAIMPVSATIAGPGERRYLSQLGMVYHECGVSPSVIWPRASFTLIDRRTTRYAAKEGIEPACLFATVGEIEAALARDTLPAPVEESLNNIISAITVGFEQLESSVECIDRTLVGPVKKDRGRVAHIIDGLRERIVRAHRSSRDMSQRRIAVASHAVMPGGNPQERWFGIDSIVGILDEIGIDTFIELTSPGEEHHRIMLFD